MAINIFPNLYAAIDPSLESDIDLSKWEEVLKRGFTSSKNDYAGIKLLEHDICEAKDSRISTRLIAPKIYINEDHKKLMLFTKEMNHAEVSRYIRNNTCEEIYCPNYNNELPLIGESSMDE